MPADYTYGSGKLVFKKDQPVSWHALSMFEFPQRFQKHLSTVRKAISIKNPGARNAIRYSLPDPQRAAQEFYALSAFRSGFTFGYLERFRDLRKAEIGFVDFMQHELAENQGRSITALLEWHPNPDQIREPLTVLHSAYQRLHDFVYMRMK